MDDYWLEDGCTVYTFGRRKADQRVRRRRNFLKKYCGDKPPYPFYHGLLQVNEDKIKALGWGIDPLVLPLLRRMNEIPGVQTFSSCQGSARQGPSVAFYADAEGALAVTDMFTRWRDQVREGSPWNHVVVGLVGKQLSRWNRKLHKPSGPRRLSWEVWFYDTLALMKFTKDFLGVSYAEQMMPPDGDERLTHLLKVIRRKTPSQDELESVLRMERT